MIETSKKGSEGGTFFTEIADLDIHVMFMKKERIELIKIDQGNFFHFESAKPVNFWMENNWKIHV